MQTEWLGGEIPFCPLAHLCKSKLYEVKEKKDIPIKREMYKPLHVILQYVVGDTKMPKSRILQIAQRLFNKW